MEPERSDPTPTASDEPERKLAAIMAADVVGYSRMMSADEVGTHRRLAEAKREVIDPVIASNRGRVFKTLGDGFLVEFPSVVLALRAALVIQSQLTSHNAAHPPGLRIVLRVGLHQGDVMVYGDDLLGDGVNVAARLEALADPGGICISGRVREDTAGKLALASEDGGERLLKNIPRPIRVYFIRPKLLEAENTARLRGASPSLTTETDAPGHDLPEERPGERTLHVGSRSPMHRLVLVAAAQGGFTEGHAIVLGPQPLCIGRLPPNDLILFGAEVSRTHCRVDIVDGAAVVTDLGSTNGTFVDGVRTHHPTRLQPGAELRIGFYVWRYTCEDAGDIDSDRTGISRPTSM